MPLVGRMFIEAIFMSLTAWIILNKRIIEIMILPHYIIMLLASPANIRLA